MHVNRHTSLSIAGLFTLPGAMLLGAVLLLAGCGGSQRPQGASAHYPGTLVSTSELGVPPGFSTDFVVEQQVRSENGEEVHEFRAVMQRRGNSLLLMGFGPGGMRGFEIELQGSEMRFESHMPEALPFDPEFMLQDVQRAWFLGLPVDTVGGTLPDGEHRGVVRGEEVVERWESGRLQRRSYRRLNGQPAGLSEFTYEGGLGAGEPPARIIVDNGWFHYRLVLTTLSHQAIDTAAGEVEPAGLDSGSADSELPEERKK